MAKNGQDTPSRMYRNFINTGKKEIANNQNDLVFAQLENMYRRQFLELCSNRFEWTNLPEEIDVRYLELTLMSQALSVFFYDEDYDKYFALRATASGVPDMEDNPTSFTIYGTNYPKNGTRLFDVPARRECVPIWANYLRTPDLDVISIYAHRLAKLDETIDINSDNSRVPVILAVNENIRLSADQILRQIQSGSRVIKVNDSTSFNIADSLTPIDLGGNPHDIEKLDIIRTRVWNQAMVMLGINSANQDKKERLVSAEVSANDEQINTFKNIALNARRHAAERINDLYGLNVEVNFKVDKDAERQHEADQAAALELAQYAPPGENEGDDSGPAAEAD